MARLSGFCGTQMLGRMLSGRTVKARTDTSGEASLRGHLKAEGDEQTSSQSYIPPDPKDDKALHTALDLIRDILKNSAYRPNPKTAVPN
jgi:carboxyl-terminal processing protease